MTDSINNVLAFQMAIFMLAALPGQSLLIYAAHHEEHN